MKLLRAFCVSLLAVLHASVSYAEKPVIISVGVPLSGALADYGSAIRNGFALAKTELGSELEGVDFRFEDHGYNSGVAIDLANRPPWGRDITLLYLWGYGMCQSAVPMAEARQLPIVAATSEEGITKNRIYVIRSSPRASDYAAAILGYLRARGLRKIGVVQTESSYMGELTQNLQKNLDGVESLTVVASLKPGKMDLREAVLKLQSGNYDAVGVLLVGPQISEFFKEAERAQYRPTVFGGSSFESVPELASAGGVIADAVFPAVVIAEDFRARYLKAYGNETQIGAAANAYDFALVLSKAKAGLKSDSGRATIDALKKTAEFRGVEGTITFQEQDGERGFRIPVQMKRVGDLPR